MDREKPKPHCLDVPLYGHNSGQYARRYNGTVHYFGTWSKGWRAALEKYVAERNALDGGLAPAPQGSQPPDVLNSFRRTTRLAMEHRRKGENASLLAVRDVVHNGLSG